MKILKTKIFELESADDITIDLVNDGSGDSVADEVIIQVEDDVNVALTGKAIDDEAFTERTVACMSLDTLKVVDIEAAGIYVVPVEALSSITLSVSGSTTLVVKVLG